MLNKKLNKQKVIPRLFTFFPTVKEYIPPPNFVYLLTDVIEVNKVVPDARCRVDIFEIKS